MGMQSASLLDNAFDKVAAYFGELLSFGARRSGRGTIEPLLRLFQAIERNKDTSNVSVTQKAGDMLVWACSAPKPMQPKTKLLASVAANLICVVI
jgi:hypothetical protein